MLRFYTDDVDPLLQVQTGMQSNLYGESQALLVAHLAHFGGDLTVKSRPSSSSLRFANGIAVHRDIDNPQGCHPYKYSYPDSVLVVHRGDCTFLEKLIQGRQASAAGLIVISDDSLPINPTANPDEILAAGDLSDLALLLLPQKAGDVLTEMMDHAEQGIISQVKMMLDTDSEASDGENIPPKDTNRILYINGHPLLNTRLLV